MSISVADEVFLNFIEQMWHTHGGIPTRAKCLEYGFDEEWYKKLRLKEVRANLIERGITESVLDNLFGKAKHDGILTELQLTAANVMLDLRDNRSQRKKLSELGISTGKWDAWLKDATFQGYLRQRAENLLGDNQHEAHYALLSRVRGGDLGAIKYYNELTGRYVPQKDTGNFDVRMLLTRVIEAIQKHVPDPQIQQAIADEILGYSQAQGLVNAIVNQPVPIPVPVGARVIESAPLIAEPLPEPKLDLYKGSM